MRRTLGRRAEALATPGVEASAGGRTMDQGVQRGNASQHDRPFFRQHWIGCRKREQQRAQHDKRDPRAFDVSYHRPSPFRAGLRRLPDRIYRGVDGGRVVAPMGHPKCGDGNMSQLEFGPASFFNTRRCSIARNGVPIGEIRCAMFGQKGSITIGDVSFATARETFLGGTYYLAADGKRLASAAKPYAFQRLFTVRFGRRSCTLKATSLFGRAYVLAENDVQIGSIARRGFFGRMFDAGLPDDLALEQRAFVIWLVIVLWRRQRRAGAAAAIAGAAAAAAGVR